ncbi:hypothetical protein CPB85DRAFT_1460576 [Mucidula mucida]|nr:hypothetical protein CPB85DRAFT_1460576 [Mucidula mucida]
MTSLDNTACSPIPPQEIPLTFKDHYKTFESSAAVEKYLDELKALLRQSERLPLRIGSRLTTTPVCLPHVARNETAQVDGEPSARLPPRFSQSGAESFVGELVLQNMIQKPQMNACHIWMAEVVALGDKTRTSLGRVRVKVLQRSRLTTPDWRSDVEHTVDGRVQIEDPDPLNILAQDYTRSGRICKVTSCLIASDYTSLSS